MSKLRLILGDQQHIGHSWFQTVEPDTIYFIAEMRQETDYVKHHIQKILGFFASMRLFAERLRHDGHTVIYYKLDDEQNRHSLTDNLDKIIQEKKRTRFEYQLPDEYRLDQQLRKYCDALSIETAAVDSEHFMRPRRALEDYFGDKAPIMESFYRTMRKEYDLLMTPEGKPEGGSWNYDHDNRKRPTRKHEYPAHKHFCRDLTDIESLIQDFGVETMGTVVAEKFDWPLCREEALDLVDYFCEHGLVHFGRYQDAMVPEEWLLYHSRISFSLNVKHITPLELVRKIIAYWSKHQDTITLSQTEGYIRQVIGWREYMRGIYWWKMPAFASMNALNHTDPLPSWYWNAETKMNCLHHAIKQSLEHAYAHHIQRLMVTGNFALLAGINPDEVDEWYLGIYMDAIEWVEITNTRGMSQYADGGIVGTKPYISSGNYINKMSHYCKDCHYNVKEKYGDNACPFNTLYWNFLDRHQEKLQANPRMSMMYRLWEKNEDKEQILSKAASLLANVNEL